MFLFLHQIYANNAFYSFYQNQVSLHQTLFLDILVRPIASQVVDLNRYPAISLYLPFGRLPFEVYIMCRDANVVNQHSFEVIFAI